MDSAFDEYIAKNQILANAVEQYKKAIAKDKYEPKKAQEDAEAKKAVRAAYSDYVGYINPYGVQAEKLESEGLGSSGLTGSNRARAYSAYQNRAAGAINTASANKNALDTALAQENAELELEMLNNDISLAKDELDEYWKQLKWDYETGRDEIADEHFERQWAYKTAAKPVAAGTRSTSSVKKSSSVPASASAAEADSARAVSTVRNDAKIGTVKKLVAQIVKDNVKIRTSENIKPYIELLYRYGGNATDEAVLRGMWGAS